MEKEENQNNNPTNKSLEAENADNDISKNVVIPESTKRVILALDNDEAGEKMFEECKERFSNLNKAVSRLRPKPEYKDFNDELRGIKFNAN